MREYGRENQGHLIIPEPRRTKEVNPQEIADVLGGKLEEGTGDTERIINLHQGHPDSVIKVRCDPEKRTISVGFKTRSGGFSYSRTKNVGVLDFYEYDTGVPGERRADMVVHVEGAALLDSEYELGGRVYRASVEDLDRWRQGSMLIPGDVRKE